MTAPAFDPHLVEETVHLLARRDEKRWRAYRRRIDPLYDGPRRNERIAEAHLEMFLEWHAGDAVETHVAGIAVDRALVARSRRPGDEGAELYVAEESRTLLLRLEAVSFLDPAALDRFLRHELRHVADMLDPAFGYVPDLGVRGRTLAERELVRSRYRVLWDIAIDEVAAPPVPPETRRAQLDRAFAALAPDQRTRLAARFRDGAARTHATLLAAARDPWAFLGEPRTGVVPGQPCPLCGFPTHDWDPAPPEAAIRADFPAWEAPHGACRQCADIYRAAAPVP